MSRSKASFLKAKSTASPVDQQRSVHGKPKPIKISKTLEPSALATAMPPSPSFATATELIASGMEMPAATTRSPMTRGEKVRISPVRIAVSIAK